MSASCMSWMSAICVHANGNILYGTNENSLLRSRFRVVTRHSTLCNAPPDWEGHCVTTLQMALKENMMRRICLEIKKFVHIML